MGRLILPPEYEQWNARHHAPQGRDLPGALVRPVDRAHLRLSPPVVRWRGPFAFQPNNLTRRWEYPWAFHAVPLRPGLAALDLGGALSGFPFTLAMAGLRVLNVDPFYEFGSDHPYGSLEPAALVAQLNRAFGTDVELRRATLDGAGVADDSVDVLYCLSTLEHLTPEVVSATLTHIRRVLRPGGRAVLTVDLFLDLAPFTGRTANRFGTNLDVAAFVAESGLGLVAGERSELCGYPEFEAQRVLAHLSEYLVGNYPGLAQSLVLEKG